MTKIVATLVALTLWVTLVPVASAQYIDQGFGCGFSLGITHGLTEQNNGSLNYLARAYLRQGFASHFTGELGLSTGRIDGRDFQSIVNPVDVRVLYSPFDLHGMNLYLYAGIGVMPHLYFDTRNDVVVHRGAVKAMGIVPVGAGLQFPLTDYIHFEVFGGYTHGLKDNLNQMEGGPTDAFWNLSFGLTWIDAGDRDGDGDGLNNRTEREIGTDPGNPDTDGDGLSDGAEVKTYHTDPLKADTDGDGLSDGQEVNVHRTDPLKADTDGDGLNDGDEVLKWKTSPTNADTDGDGLSDGAELNTHHTDPLKADSDDDGLTDGQEVNSYHTDPLKADTDGDGLTDGDEVNKYGSNPLKVDSDGDGISDADEVNKYHTKPGVADTDGGSIDDGTEIRRGTNPLDRSDDVQLKAEVGKALVLDGIIFNTGSAEILPASEEVLQKAYNTLRFNPDIIVEIHGHTDNKGSRAKNMRLSETRANAVREWLITKGVDGARLKSKGFGPDKPVGSNATEEGRASNRRIEFVRVK